MTSTALALADPLATGSLMPTTVLLGLGAAGLGVGVARRSGAERLRALLVVALAATAFQVFHVAEHALQVGYWLLHPGAAPWLTPWAAVGRDALASVADGRPASGAELLHLLGNGLFLAGLLALAAAARARGLDRGRTRSTRRAIGVQGLHVVEHVVLTATWFATGNAWGVSTGFGLLEAGTPVGGAVRVWVHFLINAVATVLALRALRDTDARGLLAAASAEAAVDQAAVDQAAVDQAVVDEAVGP